MLALYRAGRQAEALEAYRAARAALVEQIGIEPGPELRRLQESILRQDPALELRGEELPGGAHARLADAGGTPRRARPAARGLARGARGRSGERCW